MPLRVAVVGHVEHITLGRVPHVPAEGEIAHLTDVIMFPGGGGGVAFSQLAKGPTEVLLYTAIGNDDAGRFVESAVLGTGARVHAARREEPHTRDVVMVTPAGERTIVVVGEPLHPRRTDPLPWDELATCDAVYFTAQDPEALRACRAARVLVVTARRRAALVRAGVYADVVVGSARDLREVSTLEDYPVRPGALVLTEGARGGSVHRAGTVERFAAPEVTAIAGGAYGAGDTFAGALTYYSCKGLDPLAAARAAAHHGASVLLGPHPLEAQRPLEA